MILTLDNTSDVLVIVCNDGESGGVSSNALTVKTMRSCNDDKIVAVYK